MELKPTESPLSVYSGSGLAHAQYGTVSVDNNSIYISKTKALTKYILFLSKINLPDLFCIGKKLAGSSASKRKHRSLVFLFLLLLGIYLPYCLTGSKQHETNIAFPCICIRKTQSKAKVSEFSPVI